MDSLTGLTARLVTSDPSMLLTLTAALVFASIFFFSLAGMRGIIERADIRRRARQWHGSEETAPRSLSQTQKQRASNWLDHVGKLLSPNDVAGYSQARKEMVRAGFFAPSAVSIYFASRIVLSIGTIFVALPILGILPITLSATQVLFVAASLAGLAFIGPSFYIKHRQKKMNIQYRTGFPDLIDLLVVCVESGFAFQPAIDRISREIAPTAPQLAANLHFVNLELRAGSSLGDALDNLSERLGLEEALSLTSLLKQSEELGTSLSAALRVYSDEMRDKRLMRAEAMAHSLPVKITLPVGFCIFPVILIILFLPLFIRIKALLLT
jgi:tight adherence protein C